MQYSIVDKAEDIKDSKIEKLGVVVNFTFREVEAHEENLKKVMIELQAKVDYEAAKMTNIETNHPFVLSMSEQDMFTAHMYQEAKAIVLVGKQKVAEIQKGLDDYALEKVEIIKQIPELGPKPEGEAPVVTPEAVPEAVEPSPAETAPTAESLK